MIPVVMLAINACMNSSFYLTLLCLIMACPFVENIPVIYLLTVVARTILLMAQEGVQIHRIALTHIVDITVVAHLVLSLLTNIVATSIIALKAWYVQHRRCRWKDVDCALIHETMHVCIKEIPQVAYAKRDWCPVLYTGDRDIGPPGRVRYDLYSHRCKFRLPI
jgi:hypothetical protein